MLEWIKQLFCRHQAPITDKLCTMYEIEPFKLGKFVCYFYKCQKCNKTVKRKYK
jgi:hypothetical protein